jgi:hypothetical protein
MQLLHACAFITLAVAGVQWGLVRVDACTLCVRAAGLRRTGGVGENMCMPDITVYKPGITTYIESAARNGSAAFD